MRMIALLLAVFFSASLVSPQTFPRPLVRNGESAESKTVSESSRHSGSGWSSEMSERYQPTKWNRSVELNQDSIVWTRSETLAGGGKRVIKCTIKGGDRIKVLKWADTFYSPTGKIETKIEEDFTDPSLKYPDDMIPMFLLPFLLRGIDFEDQQIHELRLWHNPMSFSRGTWRVTGRKTVEVAAGKFDCFEVEMKILIDDENVIARALEKLIPKLYYYLDVNPPHNMVRFFTNLPGHGPISHDLVKFDPGN